VLAEIDVRYVTHMGDDLLVVNAARVSFGVRKEELDDRDKKLIHYLAKHKHWSPFAHPHVTLWIQAPIFVRSQCFRHKIGFTENEISRRYVSFDPEFFLPEMRKAHPSKKQGSLPELVDEHLALEQLVRGYYQTSLSVYRQLLQEGVAPEVARAVLPQGAMTSWYWTGSLYAWARFYALRTAPDAQRETALVAEKAGEIVGQLFPISWQALIENAQVNEE